MSERAARTGEAQTSGEAGDDLGRELRRIFGFGGFRANQEGIVRAIMSRRDVLAVMPTGGGKSLCYQLPACLMDGVCVVISPLISLMKDQVDAAAARGLRAAFWNSSLTAGQRNAVAQSLRAQQLDLLYVSPERFNLGGFVDLLKSVRICLLAIVYRTTRDSVMETAKFRTGLSRRCGRPLAGRWSSTSTTAGIPAVPR